MIWIGLTGGIATGKSSVSRFLMSQNYPVIDADVISKQVVAPGSAGLAQIEQVFGQGFLTKDKRLDRKKVADIIFSDPKKRQELEKIIHPLVQAEVRQQRTKLERHNTPIAFYDIPLLFENNLEKQFDYTILVRCSSQHQLDRLKLRNHLSVVEAQNRINSQLSLDDKARRANYVIQNDGTLEDLYLAVLKVLGEIKIQAGLS